MVRQWSIRPFDATSDREKVVKLLSSAAGFDGGVAAKSLQWVDAAIQSPTYPPEHWRVATASNGAVVGAMLVGLIGTLRTEVVLAVNPAWRRQGVGTGLIAQVLPRRRLLVQSRASVSGATALLQSAGFSERHRFARMRRELGAIAPPEFPSWATLEEDPTLDAERFRTVALQAFGDDAQDDLGLVQAELSRRGTRVFYLKTPQGDQGLALVCASDRSRKNELDKNGATTVGVLDRVGLGRSCRGKGLSRPLIRASMMALAEDGYREFEVAADKRRAPALELYAQEGFSEVDEDIYWIRRDD